MGYIVCHTVLVTSVTVMFENDSDSMWFLVYMISSDRFTDSYSYSNNDSDSNDDSDNNSDNGI